MAHTGMRALPAQGLHAALDRNLGEMPLLR
jgi:hypothetical protein